MVEYVKSLTKTAIVRIGRSSSRFAFKWAERMFKRYGWLKSA